MQCLVIHELHPLSYRLAEPRRDQEDGGDLDSHEKVGLSFTGPGEIKRREVVLNAQESLGEIKSREVELGSESWNFFSFSYYSITMIRTLSL